MREWEDYERGEELAAEAQTIEANLQALFDCWGVDSVERLSRAVEKDTACGAFVVLEHEGGTALRCDRVRIGVGSIVEGSDAEVGPHYIDLSAFGPAETVERFNDLIAVVEDEVDEVLTED